MSAALTVERVVAGYTRQRPRAVVGPVSLTVGAGTLVCLLGPNGAGKSTLMRTLAGMQAPLEGVVRIGADDVHRLAPRDLARRLSVVLTERVSGGLLTVYDLVALGRHPFTDWTGRLRAEDHAAVERALVSVGAEPLAGRFVAELSDGERQKAMVARALAQEPSMMILDEVTAFLDLPRRVEIMRILARLAHEHGCAVLLSTHDLDLALHTADTLWVLHGGHISAGLPEALVLDGTFEAAFASEGLAFDRTRGAFRSVRTGSARVAVRGEGLDAQWTKSAMERLGLSIDDEAPLVIEVVRSNDGPRWHTQGCGPVRQLESLAACVDVVREALPRTQRRQRAGGDTIP